MARSTNFPFVVSLDWLVFSNGHTVKKLKFSLLPICAACPLYDKSHEMKWVFAIFVNVSEAYYQIKYLLGLFQFVFVCRICAYSATTKH